MTTSAEMRALMQTNVFGQSQVTAITERVHAYDVLQESSSKIALLYHEQEINFITYVCTRQHAGRQLGTNEVIFDHFVTVTVSREADKSGTAYNATIDTLQTIEARFAANCNASNWNGSLMPFTLSSVSAPRLIFVDGKECWSAINVYNFREISGY